MKKELTCIVCPIGCTLTAELEGNKVKSVSGNTCKRGETYAVNEFTNPLRTVTTTVKCRDGGVVPVKTQTPIAKDRVFEAMKIINNFVAPLPISVGDVIIEDVCGSKLVATASKNDKEGLK